VGVISKSKENMVYDIGYESESSSLYLHPSDIVCILSSFKVSEFFNKNKEFELEDNSTVEVEVDCERKTIYYFINKKQCPFYVSDISSSSFPLLFGFRSCDSPIIEIISIHKLNRNNSYINSSVKCKAMSWVFYFICLLYYYVSTIYLKKHTKKE
jgi:hypothetical protein